MRTTLNLDDDVLLSLKEYAEQRSVALGKAASELIRRGLATETPIRLVNDFAVFDLPADSPRVTTDQVAELESEPESEREDER